MLIHLTNSIFCGGTFEFDVGGSLFVVHKVLVARNSFPLKAMMENGMLESQQGRAPLQDTDNKTFGRFVEWIHTGDYNPAPPAEPDGGDSKDGETSDIETGEGSTEVGIDIGPPASTLSDFEDEKDDTVINSPSPWSAFASRTGGKKIKKYKKKQFRSFGFDSDQPDSPPTHSELPSTTSDVLTTPAISTNSIFVSNGNWKLDYLPLFLSHARLYVFANAYLINDLAKLAARRLDESLSQFHFCAPYATNFAELIQYVFDHTEDDDEEVLRKVVTVFAANNVEQLKGSDEFRALLKSGGTCGGAFADALVGKMCDRFVSS